MNLADPELELIDPTPNVHGLFVHFDDIFFCSKLKGLAVVRWSKRMYSCAGICSYEGKGGVCDIALSEPLLKLRPRKDLIETLLHEMIHAFLFITNKDNDRDGHGPNFQAHMHRINRAAGLKISIYHDFHDEVKSYLKHWWRCNGRCQKMQPYFGVVRRLTNRAPGPHDNWWVTHKRMCGGTFIKMNEPEKLQKATKKPVKSITTTNITKYININKDSVLNDNVAKDVNKENKATNTAVPASNKLPARLIHIDKGRKRTNSTSVIEQVRNVWANKQMPSLSGAKSDSVKSTNKPNLIEHKRNSVQVDSPPKKIRKIDDFFKKNASSILKDVYGEEFIISQSSDGTKLKAATAVQSSKVPPVNIFVCCPSCNVKVYSNDINKHLDECLNKDIIEKLCKDSDQKIPVSTDIVRIIDEGKSKNLGDTHQYAKVKLKTEIKIENDEKTKLKTIVGSIQTIPPFKYKTDNNNYTTTSKEGLSEKCPSCGAKVAPPLEVHLDNCLGFFDNNITIPEEGVSNMETVVIDTNFNPLDIKSEPGTSKDGFIQKCPCCGDKIDKPIELHLDDCLGFFDNNTTIPTEGASSLETIVIDDDDDEDDIFDETQTFNATGTMFPCPCCLKMIEVADMNDHLDVCLSMSVC